MSKSEDIIYRAYKEGIRDKLFIEVNRLNKSSSIYKHMETGDKFEIAYDNITNKKKKND